MSAGKRSGGRGGDEGVSDEALMLCVQVGEHSSLQELVGRYERSLYNFLARYTGDAHLAEDIFQETFLHLIERREQFDPDRGFRPWLYSIAANLARDACRRRDVRSRFSAEVFAGKGVQEPPDVEAERREEMDLVRATLAELPEDARSMVLLHFYQGLRYKEVAEILDVPVGTVKSRVHWAVERLCRAWSEGVPSAVNEAGAKVGHEGRRSRRS